MGYLTTNAPSQIAAPMTGGANSSNQGPQLWVYGSVDPIATVQGAAYFSNGLTLGMRVGDIVFVLDTNLLRAYLCIVAALTPSGAYPPGQGSATLNSTTTPVID